MVPVNLEYIDIILIKFDFTTPPHEREGVKGEYKRKGKVSPFYSRKKTPHTLLLSSYGVLKMGYFRINHKRKALE